MFMSKKITAKNIFSILIYLWILLFIIIDTVRIFEKVKLRLSKSKETTQEASNIDQLSIIAKEKINKNASILFISDDALAYMRFNLNIYPLIAKWDQNYTLSDLKYWNYIVVDNTKNIYTLKSGVYKSDDIN